MWGRKIGLLMTAVFREIAGPSHTEELNTQRQADIPANTPAAKLRKQEHTQLIQTYMHIHFFPQLAQTHTHTLRHTLHPSVVSNSVFLPNTCVIVQLWRMLGNDRGN